MWSKEVSHYPLGESPSDKEGGNGTEKSPGLSQEGLKSWPTICFSPLHTVVCSGPSFLFPMLNSD